MSGGAPGKSRGPALPLASSGGQCLGGLAWRFWKQRPHGVLPSCSGWCLLSTPALFRSGVGAGTKSRGPEQEVVKTQEPVMEAVGRILRN